MNYKEFKIGEEFELDKIIYQVVKANSCSCKGCAFFIEDEGICSDWQHQTGGCKGEFRKDDEDVIFIKAGEATD